MNVHSFDKTVDKSQADPPSDLRRAILDAAVRVFADKGYGAATIKDIAAEANVATGTIYNYADNKRDLFIQAMRQSLLSEPVMNFISGGAPPESIQQAVADRLDFILSCSQTPLVPILSEVLRDPDLRREYSGQIVGPNLKRLEAALKQTAAAGGYHNYNARLAARVLISLLIGMVIITRIEGEASPLLRQSRSKLTRELTEMVKGALWSPGRNA